MTTDHRIAALRRRMFDENIPAMIVSGIPNVRYLTGFEDVFDDGANVACLITDQITRIYTDSRYAEATETAASGTPWAVHIQQESLYVELCKELSDYGVSSVALESSVPYGRFRFISEQFEGKVTVVDQWVETIRQVKGSAEIERIAAAAALTDRTFEHIRKMLKPGVREDRIALEIEIFMRTNGSTGMAFDPIVASGPNSARPHATVTTRVLEKGDFLTIDMGARVRGYCADMTRTVVIGTADSRQREVYAAVLAANMAGIAAVKAGLRGSEIDRAARSVLDLKGLGEYFGHGLGHGVGLDVHELPSVSPRGREAVLAGSVITVEPGVYISGFGGVRIEDLLVVEESGCTVLSDSPKELLELTTM